MGLADRLTARSARRRIARGDVDDAATAGALHRALLRGVSVTTPPDELGQLLVAARAEVGPRLDPADAARNERDTRLRLADAAVADAVEDPDGVTDDGLRRLGQHVAALEVPDALNRDAPYERIGLARSRLGLPPHALREVPRLRPLPDETPLLVERATLLRGAEAFGARGDALLVEITTRRLGLAGGARVAVPLVHIVGIDVQPTQDRPVLIEHANGSPLLLATAVPHLLVRTLRDARLARVRDGDRAATTPFPTVGLGGPRGPGAFGSMPLGSSGFSYAAPGFAVPPGQPTPADGRSTGRADRAPGGAGPDHGGLYALLGVAPGASSAEVKRAFRTAAQRTHPDTATDDVDAAEEAFKRLAHAYRVLSDPASRAAYDRGVAQPF